jgi:hypothetical protein
MGRRRDPRCTGGAIRPLGSLLLLLLAAIGGPWLAAAGAQQTTASAPVRIAVIGDINGAYGTVGYSQEVRTAVRRIVELNPDLVIGVGDLVAGQRPSPHLDRGQLEEMWAAFYREVWDPLVAAGIPFVPVAGNHDASPEPAFALEREIFAEQWRLHRPTVEFVSEQGFPFRYGFTFHDVVFVVLDATRVGPLSPEQRSWLQDLLRSAPVSRARIVAGHLPIHAFTHGRETETLADAALERILGEGRVALYLSGHHHAFYPGFTAGLLQVSQGCLGSGARRLLGSDQRSPRSFTVVEVSATGEITIDALSAPAFTSAIDLASLPRSIRYGGVEIVREDVAAADAPGSGGSRAQQE